MTKPETRPATCNLQSKCEPQSDPQEGDSNQSIGFVVRLGVGAAHSADSNLRPLLSLFLAGKSITDYPEQANKDHAEDKLIEREQHEDEWNLATSQFSLPGK